MSDRESALGAFLSSCHAPCPKCGYDLHGGKDASCPECGLALELHLVPAYRQVKPLYLMLTILAAATATHGLARVTEVVRMWYQAYIGRAAPFTWYWWPSGLFDIAATLEVISGILAVALLTRSLVAKRPLHGLTFSVGALAVAAVVHALASIVMLVWFGWNYW